jgi:hypothetical protein
LRRVFYFSGYRLKVFEWNELSLLGSFEFEPDDNGHEQFREFLAKATPCAGQLLVDVIEEDFRRESIPHVAAKDREVLIDRLFDRHYRGDRYVYHEILGRSKEGRKDDQVLISSVANLESAAAWLDDIEAAAVPIAGIWSVPLLTSPLLKQLSITEDNVLIVSRQVISALRESYFQKKRMVFSRLAKIDFDVRDDESPSAFLETLSQETDQTYRFLTNQRIMGFTESLHVYVIVDDELVEPLTELSDDTNNIKYRFIGLSSVYGRYRLTGLPTHYSDALYSFLCANANVYSDHYGDRKQKLPYYRYLVDRSISQVAVLGALFLATMAAALWLYSTELRQEAAYLDKSTLQLSEAYDVAYSPIQYQLDDAATIQQTVELADRLSREGAHTPQRFFTSLADIFSLPEFRVLQLNELEWKKLQSYQIDQMKQEYKTRTTLERGEYDDYDALDNDEEDDNGEGQGNLPRPVLTIKGVLTRGQLTYRDVVAKLDRFIAALQSLPSVEAVQAKRMPVDVRLRSNFTDESGVRQEAKTASEINEDNGFDLTLVLRAADHE